MRIAEQKFKLPNGEIATIRSAGPEDSLQVLHHRKTVAAETHFMARYPEECTTELEKLIDLQRSITDSPKDFLVSAFVGDKMIGDLGVTMIRPYIKYRHRAYLGMSVIQKYTSMGLGTFMMQTALDQARENGFEQVELGVFSDNARARHLYTKMGFKEYGMNPRAFRLKDGTYLDEIIMVNFL